jgi:ATP-dependent DNA ligase
VPFPSRWSTWRSSEWEPVEPKLVVEIEYDHFTGERFRHGTKLLRFRPDEGPTIVTSRSSPRGEEPNYHYSAHNIVGHPHTR